MEKVGDLLREKILVVDNARFNRTMTAEILARVGYSTVEVENGTRALEMVQVESPDLIVLDSPIPELDGLEVCRHLKSDPFTNHIPILIFTSNGSVPDKVNSLRTGADGYLAKPIVPEELIAQVDEYKKRVREIELEIEEMKREERSKGGTEEPRAGSSPPASQDK